MTNTRGFTVDAADKLAYDRVMKVAKQSPSFYQKSAIGQLAHDFLKTFLDPEYAEYHLPYLSKYSEWYVGSTRVSYFDRENGVVYKVPLDEWGLSQNDTEAYWEGEIPLADCRLVPHLRCEEIDVLEMEIVQPLPGDGDAEQYLAENHEEIPEWLYWIDSEQAGYTKDGRLVAYDL